MSTQSIADRAGERVTKFTVEERRDAWGNAEFCVVAHGEFRQADPDWRMVKVSRRVVFVTPDAKDAYREAGWLNAEVEASA